MKLTSGRIRRASRISSCVLPSLARSTMHSALKVRHQSEDAYVLVGGEAHSHHVRSTLTSSALDGLQLATQLGRQHFEDPSVGVLVHERPIEIEDDKLLSWHGARWVFIGMRSRGREFLSEIGITALIAKEIARFNFSKVKHSHLRSRNREACHLRIRKHHFARYA